MKQGLIFSIFKIRLCASKILDEQVPSQIIFLSVISICKMITLE